MLHRPLFPGTRPEETAYAPASRDLDLDRESIWISYRPISLEAFQPSLGFSSRIIAWQLQCLPGNGSKSAAALRRS
jgi:hypothetical protein